jgi:hypothetical protein
LTWSLAEKYIGHFFCTGTQCSVTFFQQKTNFKILQNLSFGWQSLDLFAPAFAGFFQRVSIANFLEILGICTNVSSCRQKIEFLVE